VKYPKLAAAIDEMLANLVRDNGESLVELALTYAMKEGPVPASSPEGAKEKPPPIPVTKELVLSEQTEVRNGD